MIDLNGNNLTLEQLVRIARHHELVQIDPSGRIKVAASAAFVEAVVEREIPVYGINTGFGKLADVLISKDAVEKLQKNLLLSHACGIGGILSEEVVRAMMVERVNALIKGYSGVRLETVDKLVEFLNRGIVPVVFEQGSLGASGDLALLSHMSLPLLGEGEVFYQGIRQTALQALQKAKITPLSHLRAKEGLSLINGTQAMNSIGALALYDAYRAYHIANLSMAMTFQALEGIVEAFDDRVHQVRGHQGQIRAAAEIRRLIDASLLTTHQGEKRVQDAYSLRCTPQVHGAVLDTLDHVKMIVETELNAVVDNPLIFTEDGCVISAGNFHGEPLAFAFDFLGIAVSELANISERRLERLVNPQLNNGLPPFLTHCSGVNSGYMIVQYAAASIVSENKVLSHPASVDSIPSSGNQEDHVSMGSISARKAKTIVDNVIRVLGMELCAAAQAVDFRDKAKLSPITANAHAIIRAKIPHLDADQLMYPLLHEAERMIKHGDFDSLLME
jgi:histidine ammonia-lyase